MTSVDLVLTNMHGFNLSFGPNELTLSKNIHDVYKNLKEIIYILYLNTFKKTDYTH